MLGFSLTENSFLFTYHLIAIYYLISSITLRDASSETATSGLLPKRADTGTTAPITTNIPRASGSGTPHCYMYLLESSHSACICISKPGVFTDEVSLCLL
jgi:hypothetical protein